MICSKCGSKLPTKASFCPKCCAWIKLPDMGYNATTTQSAHQQRPKKSRAERLDEWSKIAETPYFQEDGAVQGGRKAEIELQSMVKSHLNYKGAHSFLGKRVAAPDGRKEIDLIIATRNILHTIEIKNWSGELQLHGNKWVQIKTNGERIEHPNIVVENNQKQRYLLSYLKQKGLDIPQNQVSQKVILMNPKLRLDPVLYNNPNVITQNKLKIYLNQQKRTSFAEKIICSVIDYCVSQNEASIIVEGLFGSITSDKFNRLVTALQELRTWDKVHFYGTKVLNGDLRGVTISGQLYDIQTLKSGSQIKVQWTRNRLIGLTKAYLNLGSLGKVIFPNGEVLPLDSKDSILFHSAGHPKVEAILFKDIELITIG